MGENERNNFGRYIEQLRKIRGKSLRETGRAIGVSPQFYSEVEKGRRGAFTKERMEMFANYLVLNEEERRTLYDKAKAANNTALPMDCEDYAADITLEKTVSLCLNETEKKDMYSLADENRTREFKMKQCLILIYNEN